jgi:hypothetical protein
MMTSLLGKGWLGSGTAAAALWLGSTGRRPVVQGHGSENVAPRGGCQRQGFVRLGKHQVDEKQAEGDERLSGIV